MKKNILALLTVALLILAACNKEKVEPVQAPTNDNQQTGTGTFRLKIENVVDDVALQLNKKYVSANGDTFTVTKFDYYLSNFALVREDGSEYKIPNSYYYITSGTSSSRTIDVTNIPVGKFVKIKFSFGVDSVANHTISHDEGDLDPAGGNAMIWTWSSGYKFIRAEGTYRDSVGAMKPFVFHIGKDSNYRTFVLDGDHAHARTQHLNIDIRAGKVTEAHIVTEIQDMFKSPNVIDLKKTNTAHGGSTTIMANIEQDFFMLHHLVNE